MNEEYFNQFSFTQMSNIMNNANTSSGFNSSNGNQYTLHTLQPPQASHNQSLYNQYISSNNPNINHSYLTLTSNQQLQLNNLNQTFNTKLTNRGHSFNSPSIGSSSSSSSPSMTSQNAGHTNSSNANIVSSSTSDSLDLEQNNSNTSDPAEMARIKQLRGIKLTQDEIQLLVKDRQRKDNHNMSKKIP